MQRKEFLNRGILGSGAGVPTGRAFRTITKDHLLVPDYEQRFFETSPTMWASAYAFEKTLVLAAKGNEQEGNPLEEWATLFMLHYCGALSAEKYPQAKLESEYDPNLWRALNGAYLIVNETPKVILLASANGVVAGAYYPGTIFFLSRNRDAWLRSSDFRHYLEGKYLSWEKSYARFLTSRPSQKEVELLRRHLFLVANTIPNRQLGDALGDFVRGKLGDFDPGNNTLDPDPTQWQVPGSTLPNDEVALLDAYPLREGSKEKGYTYYLLENWPNPEPWMSAGPRPGWPAPLRYRRTGVREITVSFAGQERRCQLKGMDKIKQLRDLFIDQPDWCRVPKHAPATTRQGISLFRDVHRFDLHDPLTGDGDETICLLPVTSSFLEDFPAILNPECVIRTSADSDSGNVTWTFPLFGKEVRWTTPLAFNRAMLDKTAYLWPPKVAENWHFYLLQGTGEKDGGQWHLVDEQGQTGQYIELAEDEYCSVLHQVEKARPNRPRALVQKLTAKGETGERGALLFKSLADVNVQDTAQEAHLAVDLGTSNTCLAYKIPEGNQRTPEVLQFTLNSEILWGTDANRYGYVPRAWAGSNGFFPTILLSRRNDADLRAGVLASPAAASRNLEYLLKVDIPELRQSPTVDFFAAQFSDWDIHTNLKWEEKGKRLWRALFLKLALLYAHAEMFFVKQVKVGNYVFTYPLAFDEKEHEEYQETAEESVNEARNYCYGATAKKTPRLVNESNAIATSVSVSPSTATIDVFIDVGGGTTDLAIKHNDKLLVMDSVKIAGKTFFHFAQKNFESRSIPCQTEFKRHLNLLLHGDGDAELELAGVNSTFPLPDYYTVGITRLGGKQFREREHEILKKGLGHGSYQKYRTRLLFQHTLAYGLLHTCAAVVAGANMAGVKVKLPDSVGINLILGGNAWGLLLFGEMNRNRAELTVEAEAILGLLKAHILKESELTEAQKKLLANLKIASVRLLNETELHAAKTNLAKGALNAAASPPKGDEKAASFVGLTLENLSLNEAPEVLLGWYERWSLGNLRAKAQLPTTMKDVNSLKFKQPADMRAALTPLLSVFTVLGDVSGKNQDKMPGDAWNSLNGAICQRLTQLRGARLGVSPISHFLAELLYNEEAIEDFLDTLAHANGHL